MTSALADTFGVVWVVFYIGLLVAVAITALETLVLFVVLVVRKTSDRPRDGARVGGRGYTPFIKPAVLAIVWSGLFVSYLAAAAYTHYFG